MIEFCVVCKMATNLRGGPASVSDNLCAECFDSQPDLTPCQCCGLPDDFHFPCTWCHNPICKYCDRNGTHNDRYDCYTDPADFYDYDGEH